MSSPKPRVVVVGGNFAGLVAASRLPRRYDVTVIDPRDEFEWTPNIHEILSGVKTRDSVVLPRAACVGRYGHAFVQDTVTRLDTANNQIMTSAGLVMPYDACLIAAGSQRSTFGVPGAGQHSIGLRLADDAVRIATRLDKLARRKRRRRASVVIVGGGVSGIEAVGEMLRRDQDIDVHVVEQAARVLYGQPDALIDDAERRAQEQRVHLHTDVTVASVDARRVTLSDGEVLPADLCIWSAGMALPQFLRDSDLCAADDDWLPVEPSLRSRYAPNVFVAGDCAGLPTPLRKQAYYAMDMGQLAGDNIAALLCERPLARFRPKPMPMLIAFGSLTTWLVAGEHAVASPLFAAAKEGVYQATMARLASPHAPLQYSAGVVARAATAAQRLLLPQLKPAALLRCLTGGRILS